MSKCCGNDCCNDDCCNECDTQNKRYPKYNCPCCIAVPGPRGPRGFTGMQGPQGPVGSGLSAYAYVYNKGAQSIAVNAPITFNGNSNLLNIQHNPGSSNIIIGKTGVYAIWFNVTPDDSSQFTLFVNGVPRTDSIYGNENVDNKNVGMVILYIAAGSILTLVNYTSLGNVNLKTSSGGENQIVNASVLIMKLN